MKFCVFSSDPLFKYHEKGEIKKRYWNPDGLFDEVCVFTFCDRDIDPGKVQALVGDAQLEVVPLGPPGLLATAGQIRQAVARLRRFGPDVIRVHNPWHAGLVGISAARRLGVPVVLSLHTHYDARRRWEKRPLLRLLRWVERWTVPRADAVWCVSHYLEDYARRMGARRIEVIYNRVYCADFSLATGGGGARPVILCVARLDPPKDQACLIEAVAGLDADLVLVGDGENKAELESLVRRLGLEERVRFVGPVPHAQIAAQYAAADVFALATHYEGFGIPLLEAMAAGLPVVASQTEPLPEILGGTGWQVPTTPAGFRTAFEEVLADPEEARQRGRAARRRAEALDGSLVEKREADLYRSLAGVAGGDDREKGK